MRYQGGKFRLKNDICRIINEYRKPGQLYVEPFLGGCNILPYLSNPRIGNDINRSIILFYRAIRDGWIPPTEISEDQWHILKGGKDSPLRGFAGMASSFGGNWFDGYARLNGHNRALKTAKLIQGVSFYHNNYYELNIPNDSIVYCDPPYRNTRGYKFHFDFGQYYSWLRDLSKKCTVICSEVEMPNRYKCIWQKRNSHCFKAETTRNKDALRVEKLFMLR